MIDPEKGGVSYGEVLVFWHGGWRERKRASKTGESYATKTAPRPDQFHKAVVGDDLPPHGVLMVGKSASKAPKDLYQCHPKVSDFAKMFGGEKKQFRQVKRDQHGNIELDSQDKPKYEMIDTYYESPGNRGDRPSAKTVADWLEQNMDLDELRQKTENFYSKMDAQKEFGPS